ncbi:MAG TPA: right-handed parallel beta-helix repeat-containing protein [Phycisphaerales bacterium]|nr:right-handed parallel beta-helix repeat-containing protein [Phycisphaerales bacterium]
MDTNHQGAPGSASDQDADVLGRRALLGVSAGVLGIAALAARSGAGPLNPPAGPLGPTGRTLLEIEPRTPVQSLPGNASNTHVIGQSGNYYLTGDIVRVPGKTAILITADHVTIDLNGYSLIGNRTGGGIESGIEVFGSHKGVHVRNGTIRGWPFYGVIGYGERCRFEDLRIENNGAGGLEMSMTHSLVHRCIVHNDAEISIGAGHGSLVSECVVFGGNRGIMTGEASIVRDCTVQGAGFGVDVGSGIVERCTVRANNVPGAIGIAVVQATRIEANTVVACGDTGIRAQRGSTVCGNIVMQCGVGIDLIGSSGPGSVGAFINRAERNNLSSNATGFRAQNGGSVIVANTVAGSGAQSYSVVAGNPMGTVRSDPAASTSAWDNFAF